MILSRQSEGWDIKLIKKIKGSLFAKIFAITFLLTSICCVLTYTVISWLVPKTYSTTLDANLENMVSSFITELQTMSPLESGKLFDEFLLNNNGVLLQLFDENGNAIELPSQGAKEFPHFLDGGIATENTDPAAYRATHSYLFSFAGSDTVYTLTVAGSAHEVDLLRNTLANVFIILFFVILIIATLASMIYSRYVTRPVLRLSAVSKNMSALNFNWNCEEDRTDELGVLAHSLNEMSKKLSAALENLQAANIKLQADIEHEKELEQAQLDFFSAVSHELKTPIALIQGYAEGLQESISDNPEDMDYYCDVIIDEAGKMNKMVKNLLTLNQLEFGNGSVNMERFDITSVIAGVIHSMQIKANEKQVNIEFNQMEPIYVWADEFQIEEVITNYLSNALNHVDEKRIIQVKIQEKNGIVRVSVFNTGKNIPENELENIWIKFYKVDKARTREYGGSGIGLSIVKAIMESMNQEYGVQNFDNGVEFWFTLDRK